MTAEYLYELGILVHVNHLRNTNVIGYGVEVGMHLILPLSTHGSLDSLLNGLFLSLLTMLFFFHYAEQSSFNGSFGLLVQVRRRN